MVQLKEQGGWRAEFKINCLSKKGESCGKVHFGTFNCGGDLIMKSILSPKRYRFTEKLTYGNCVKGCELELNLEKNTYSEYCKGRRAGGGRLISVR